MIFKYYYFIEKDYEKCEEIGEIVLNSEIEESSLWIYARFFGYMGNFGMEDRFTIKYITSMKDKINHGSSTWEDYYNLGFNGYYRLGEYEKSIPMLKRAIELNSDYNDLHALLGDSYLVKSDYYDLAITEFSTFINHYDEESPLKLTTLEFAIPKIFYLYKKTNRYQDGISFFEELEEKNYLHYYALTMLYFLQKDYSHLSNLVENILSTEGAVEKIEKYFHDSGKYSIATVLFILEKYSDSWEIAAKFQKSEDKYWTELINGLKQTEWYKSTLSQDS